MLSIEIETDNAATKEPDAIADLLVETAAKIRQGFYTGRVTDYNGNRVGSYSLDIEREEDEFDDPDY